MAKFVILLLNFLLIDSFGGEYFLKQKEISKVVITTIPDVYAVFDNQKQLLFQ